MIDIDDQIFYDVPPPAPQVRVVGNGSLRDRMPQTAAWVDQLRAAFGDEEITDRILRAKRGEPTFFARENGMEFGTPLPDPIAPLNVSKIGGLYCAGCDGRCVGTSKPCTTA